MQELHDSKRGCENESYTPLARIVAWPRGAQCTGAHPSQNKCDANQRGRRRSIGARAGDADSRGAGARFADIAVCDENNQRPFQRQISKIFELRFFTKTFSINRAMKSL